jgi:hypothetical protein
VAQEYLVKGFVAATEIKTVLVLAAGAQVLPAPTPMTRLFLFHKMVLLEVRGQLPIVFLELLRNMRGAAVVAVWWRLLLHQVLMAAQAAQAAAGPVEVPV